MVEGVDEELCIIPDMQSVLSQSEKDETATQDGECNAEVDEVTLTLNKYKDENPQTCCKCGWVRNKLNLALL